MIFSSLLFLFRFLPIVLLLYFVAPKRFRNAILFVSSLIFYAWGEPVYVVLMLFSTAVDFTHGWIITRAKEQGNQRKAKAALISAMVINLTLLCVFKYTDFLIQSVNAIVGSSIPTVGLPLPIGISFYTFQTMSYSIDIYRGDAKLQKNMIDFGAYVAMFPQLIAGPIVRYQTVADELNHRQETPEEFANGVALFMVGLGKKVLLANNIGMLWDTVVALPVANMSVLTSWLGAVAFGLQIYFDFAGYSDMARGLGRMMGFHFDLNFNYPYISRSITEFWRRWHISLGTWFREYVYIPLGGNRKGPLAQMRNIFIVWMLTGIWHGANVNFLLWGVYFGVLLIIEKQFLLKRLQNAPKVVGWVYTMILVLISWVIFASVDGQGGLGYFASMFGLRVGETATMGGVPFLNSTTLYLLRNYGIMLILCAVGATPLPACLAGKVRNWLSGGAAFNEEVTEASAKSPAEAPAAGSTAWQVLWSLAAMAMFVVCTAYLVDATYNPFLYFRF
ncbi:MAG: MBOAT family protein [Lachnospiraceae bacterium]|nr:MBOAT family protein [Lachnospiraceae bacterium]